MSSTINFSHSSIISSFLHRQTLEAQLIEAQWQVTVAESRLNQAREKMAKFGVESKSITDMVREILDSYDAGTCSDSQWKRGNGHMLRLTGLRPENEQIQKEIREFSGVLERAKENCESIAKRLHPNGLLVAEQNINRTPALILLNIPNNNIENSMIINHAPNQNSVHSNSSSSTGISPPLKRRPIIQVMKTSQSPSSIPTSASDNNPGVDSSKKQRTRKN